MTVNTDRLLWAITDLRVIGGTCDYLTQDYVSVIVVASLQKEIPMPKVCVATEHDKPKMTVVEIVIPDSYIQSPAAFSTSNIPDSQLLASFFVVFRFSPGCIRKFAGKTIFTHRLTFWVASTTLAVSTTTNKWRSDTVMTRSLRHTSCVDLVLIWNILMLSKGPWVEWVGCGGCFLPSMLFILSCVCVANDRWLSPVLVSSSLYPLVVHEWVRS